MAETQILIFRRYGIWHLIAGIVMALMGVYVWFNPAVTMVALAMYLGILFIVIGAGYFAFSFSTNSGWYLLVGLLDIFVGAIFLMNLGVTADSMPIIFALWCLAVGIIQVVSGLRAQSDGFPGGWTMTAGIIGILFAFLILAYPGFGSLTIALLMGSYILLYGAVEIAEYFLTKD